MAMTIANMLGGSSGNHRTESSSLRFEIRCVRTSSQDGGERERRARECGEAEKWCNGKTGLRE